MSLPAADLNPQRHTVSSRDEILSRVRLHQQNDVTPTTPFTEGILFADPHAHYAEILSSVGGRCERVTTLADASAHLEGLVQYTSAAKTCSLVEGVGITNFDLQAVSDPHDVEDVDFAILPGQLAVAENAAVWVSSHDPVHRILHFLTQHLALVVPSARVISNLHEAYEQLEVGPSVFGTWISGPSKTADIEQSLVIGAHGARSLTVFLVDELP